jgi:hypothetical protein
VIRRIRNIKSFKKININNVLFYNNKLNLCSTNFKGSVMKRFLLLFTIIFGILMITEYAFADGKDEVPLVRSELVAPVGAISTTYPVPFTTSGKPIVNDWDNPPVSTGYYFTISGDPAGEPWVPNNEFLDTTEDVLNWRKIITGPNQKLQSYWDDPDNADEGLRYFRNPNNPNDSVDQAFAGPIPIGFHFEFNGLVYDSFYVSTDGFIILTNPRYIYDSQGNRIYQDNDWTTGPSSYNIHSNDWFITGTRAKHGNWLGYEADGTTPDQVPDDWGYQNAVASLNYGGSYPSNFAIDNHGAIIAPFMMNGYLSQYDGINQEPRERGKVWYYHDPGGNKLIVYFVDMQLIGSIAFPFGTYTVQPGTGSGTMFADKMMPYDNGYVSASGQIILDRRDMSITFVYEKFSGRYSYSLYYWNANSLVRFNSSCAVSGWARHKNFDSKKARYDQSYVGDLPTNRPWADEYPQSTYTWAKWMGTVNDVTVGYPAPLFQAIKFKQWKNTLRVVDLSFRVRKKEKDSPEFTEEVKTSQVNNYEILAGHEQVGQLQPVAIVQNLTNDIQSPSGYNYQDQDLNFRVRCAIINQATKRPLYNKYLKVDSTAIARKVGEEAFEKTILTQVDLNGSDYEADTSLPNDYYDDFNELVDQANGFKPDGVHPYGFVQVYFPPFEPNELFINHIGLMKAFIMADPTDPRTGEDFGDMWPFDDTLGVRFWVMRNIPNDEPFVDDVREFHVVPDEEGSPYAIPSVYKWVSIGAYVVNGDIVSRHPLPPRGEYECNNNDVYPGYVVPSPCIKLQRPPMPPIMFLQYGGYEIRSHPIDMLDKEGAVLTLAVQRTTNRDDWERGFSDRAYIGCEARVVSSNWYSPYGNGPDELDVEFARPTEDWEDGDWITNIPTANWRHHPRRDGAAAEKKMAAYTLYGGGGYMVGFLETDKDSALAPPVLSGNRAVNGLRYNYWDDGIDFEYQKLYVPIPDTFIRAENDGAKFFRFRIRVYARNHQTSNLDMADDEDPFYIDNIRILYSDQEDVDIELTRVNADWPFTVAPASQATQIPIRMKISNNTSRQAPSFWIKSMIVREQDFNELFYLDDAWVWRGDPEDEDMIDWFRQKNQEARDSARWMLMHKKPIYCRTKQIPFLQPGENQEITMPNWNARKSPQGNYIILGVVYVPGGDLEPRNDTTYSTVNIKFGPVFAYHPLRDQNNVRSANNDVPRIGGWGKGLNLLGYTMGGNGSWYDEPWSVGDRGGDGGSGQIAMKFQLFTEDTIFGYGAFFAPKNYHPDWVTYRMYEGESTPGQEIANSMIQRQRGYDEVLDSSLIFDSFVYVTLPEPIVLKEGFYWVSVAQLAEAGMELGASGSKSGMRSTYVYFSPSPPYEVLHGSAAYFLNIEKSFREKEGRDENMLNLNFFAYENGLGSNEWQQFTPTIGNPAYAHLEHRGLTSTGAFSFSRGSWMPLIVPYLGPRSYSPTYPYIDCDIPVELTYFEGSVRQDAIDLIWETASEVNNYGFHVERRVVGDETGQWTTLSDLIAGHGTSNIPHEYNYVDNEVVPNTTYQYRLRQIDLDGTQSCDDFSNIVTLTYVEDGAVVLLPNTPNPFNSEGTTMHFRLPESAHVRLDILDIYGNIVTTLLDESVAAGPKDILWRAEDKNGQKVASGAYIYRLKVGDEILTGNMSLVK